MTIPSSSLNSIFEHLRELGVAPGMNLVVHARSLSFGFVAGGDAAIYEALREAVGPTGTIVVPTFTLWLEQGEAYDRDCTPSQRLGTLPEYVRRLPGARRSRCPMHNFAGVGPRSDVLEESSGDVSLGYGSDFEAMSKSGFNLLFLGCSFKDAATYTMHVEALIEVPFRKWLELQRFVVGPTGEKTPVLCRYYARSSMDLHEDLQVIEDHMMETGLVRKSSCPLGSSYLMKISDFENHVTQLLMRDPYVTVRSSMQKDD